MKRLILIGIFGLLAACAQDSGNAGGDDAGPVDLATALARADADKGKSQFIYCQACHSLNEGGMNKVGPNLYGFYGRAAAQAEGFVYSDALTAAGISWDDAALDKWIEAPAVMVPGTTMVFAGIRDQQQRADLIAYLRQITAAQ